MVDPLPAQQASAPESAGENPDLRAVVEEFGRLLAIFEAQLGAAVSEADRECMAVGEAFHGLASAKDDIAGNLGVQGGEQRILAACERIGASLTAAVMALQYHDRLSQRVEHIRMGLHRLQTHLRDDTGQTHEDWMAMLKRVEHRYYLEQKRLEAVARGPGSQDQDASAGPDNVELF
jgi:hypothetical protein